MQVKDYLEFKERVGSAPERLPTVEQNGEWTEMMAKSQSGMAYRAWRHILPYGGTEYLSTTTFEHCTVEEMCDFFNCDDVRASWDRLLYRHRVLERAWSVYLCASVHDKFYAPRFAFVSSFTAEVEKKKTPLPPTRRKKNKNTRTSSYLS